MADEEEMLDYARRAIEHAYDQGWTDGLPVVPVTRSVVEEFLATTDRPEDEVIATLRHLKRECTVERAAVNAAMAGCRPEYFPVVLAAMDALWTDRTVQPAWQSTSGPAPLIIVNGPIREELGINSRGGVFGPGFRANATIARAVGLIVRNVFGVRPQELEQATQGVPGRWSLCIGENEEESPWEPLSVELGQPAGGDAVSALLLRTCEFVDNRHTQDAEEVLWDFADTISRTGAAIGRHSSAGLVLGVEHAQTLAEGGFGKADVQHWLYEHCVRSHAELERAGKGLHGMEGPGIDEHGLHMLPSPEQLLIVVAGARNAAISMVVRPFGFAGWTRTSHPVRRASPLDAPSLDGLSIDEAALAGLRGSLAADDYRLSVRGSGGGVQVRITAGPQACEDCLVPKPLMLNVLTDALGVPADAITLIYPTDQALDSSV